MSFDRNVEQENFHLSTSKEVKLDDITVPLYARKWCKQHCEAYGECGWLRRNCPYYNTPQWHRNKKTK